MYPTVINDGSTINVNKMIFVNVNFIHRGTEIKYNHKFSLQVCLDKTDN